MNATVLLIIDAQVNMFKSEPVHDGENVLTKIKQLLDKARESQIPIVFMQNQGGSGDPDEPGTLGWEIHPILAPINGEVVFTKETPNSFYKTGLVKELKEQGVEHLIIAGMQTEVCIDTAVRFAHGLGYSVTLVADGHSTFDGVITAAQAVEYHNDILGMFATVKLVEQIHFGEK